jgi:all-trans-retinol 13,14-reductase
MREHDCDVIVIGSGIGGMTSAAALAHRGYKVLVFEAGLKPGGYCQSFSRKGFRFNTSVHKAGGYMSSYLKDCFLKELGVEDPLQWINFPEFVQIEDFRSEIDNVNLPEALCRYFPQEADNVQRFFRETTQLFDEFMHLERNRDDLTAFNPAKIPLFMKYQTATIGQILDDYFHDPRLKAILYAVSEGTSFLVGLVPITLFALSSGKCYLPVGGMESFIERLIKVLERNGGQIHYRSRVNKILVKNGRVCGVEVNGQQYTSRYIVSNVDLRVTYAELIGEEHMKPSHMEKIMKRWKVSPSCISVWVGLDREMEHFGWQGENITYYPSFEKVFDVREQVITPGGKLSSDLYSFIGSSANLDPTSNPAGCSQFTLGIPIASDFEGNWGIGEDGKKGAAYREVKQRVADRLLDLGSEVIPGLRDHIAHLEIGTPLTYERYSGNIGGAYLGYALDARFLTDRIRPDAKGLLPGLYFSSNWSAMGGGVTKIMLEGIRGVDLILAEDGRHDEKYDFERRYFLKFLDDMKAGVVSHA